MSGVKNGLASSGETPYRLTSTVTVVPSSFCRFLNTKDRCRKQIRIYWFAAGKPSKTVESYRRPGGNLHHRREPGVRDNPARPRVNRVQNTQARTRQSCQKDWRRSDQRQEGLAAVIPGGIDVDARCATIWKPCYPHTACFAMHLTSLSHCCNGGNQPGAGID
jgi:hypothetical protein